MDTSRQLLRVAQVVQIDPDVRLFRLKAAEKSAPLSSFLPGQYISLFYTIGQSTASRPYSIASSPKDAQGPDGYYDLLIHGGGPFTSAWLFENIHEGSTIEASQPLGDFHIQPENIGKNIIGISGGMSVTPLLSMAKAVADGSLDANLTLFCGWEDNTQLLYRKELTAYQQNCPRLKVVFCLLGGALPGDEPGYPRLETIKKYCKPENAVFFVCGPPEMYSFLKNELAPLAIPTQDYYQEVPGEANLDNCGGTLYNETYTLCVNKNGVSRKIPMRGDETLLVSMERAGLSPQARCRSGHCGYCRSLMRHGSIWSPPSRDKRTAQDHENHIIHPCCSFPLSDIEIDAPD